MKQTYIPKRFQPQSLRLIGVVEGILDSFERQDMQLSLRQLFYQLVATAYDEIPDKWADPETKSKNSQKAYDNLGSLVSDARLAGLLDWSMLQDRGRVPYRLAMWEDEFDRLFMAARTHRLDKWMDQPNIVWVMAEKQAVDGIMIPICQQLEVPYVSNKGYSSQSTMYEIGREFKRLNRRHDKDIHVLYLGDHDPSGMDMTDDVRNRLEMFAETEVTVHRIALNMDQVREYNPPPNFAKETDSRFAKYAEEYGEKCWELDALTPNVMRGLVAASVEELRDEDIWQESIAKQEEQRGRLTRLAERVKKGKVKLV